MEKVSIIVPVHNVAPYLERCIQSLLHQDCSDYEIILVNDGSTDNSGEICDAFVKKHAIIKIIHHQNCMGLSAARNSGLDAAEGDFVTFVDSDDFVRCDFLQKLTELAEHYGAQLVQCGYEKGTGSSFTLEKQPFKTEALSAKDALSGYHLKSQACCKLYKRELFSGVRFPVGVIHEDEYITYKLAFRCKRIVLISEKLYYYYQRPASIMGRVTQTQPENRRRNDWVLAYLERIAFFKEKNEIQLVYRTYEKFCVDIILRYVEMIRSGGEKNRKRRRNYHRVYKRCYVQAMKKTHIPWKRKIIYSMFRFFPGICGHIAAHFNLRG